MTSSQSTCDPSLKETIRQKALQIGFSACGFAKAEPVDSLAKKRYDDWINAGRNDCMDYTERYRDVRDDPRLLIDGAKTVISTATNYYPKTFQSSNSPQFAYYAYGSDYHDVVKKKLFELAAFIKRISGAESRVCVDTAPIREKYWAQRAGIGFVGRNNLLILPGRGSYFFLGEIVTTLSAEPDQPCGDSCGDCRLCETRCPGHALSGGQAVDAARCLSCQLIEQRGELPQWVGGRIGNRIYGCDECQKCCPHNRGAVPTDIEEFSLREGIKNISREEIDSMSDERFRDLFKGSAVRRIKLPNLKRNLHTMQNGDGDSPKG